MVVDARPDDVFPRVLLLLQLENVPDKELLQLLVGKIDAQLLEAGGEQNSADVTKRQTKKCVRMSQMVVQKPVVVEVLKAEDVE